MTSNVKYSAERPGIAPAPIGGGRGAAHRSQRGEASVSAQRMAVTTTGLSKRYGDTRVVDSVDLAVPEHTVYGFLGPNGAGKSTTMKMLLGLVHPTEGSATVLGTPLTPENRLEVLRHVGSLIESPSCYPHLTARENLEIVRQLRGLPKSEIDEVLKIVRLDDPSVRRKRVGNFSLGMKQRLGIAAALMGRPPLLLLDEPTSGLDPLMQERFLDLVEQERARGAAILLSSHIFEEVGRACDRVAFIRAGRVAMTCTMEEVRSMRGRGYAVEFSSAAERSRWELAHGDAPAAGDARGVELRDVRDVNALIRELSSYDVAAVTSREQTLEELFLHLYEGDASSRHI